jgi:hypothetical protein
VIDTGRGGGAVIDTGRGGGGGGGSNSFRVNYSSDKQTVDPHQQQQKRNLNKNNHRYYGSEGAFSNSDWTFENNDYHKFYEEDADHSGSATIPPQEQADLL